MTENDGGEVIRNRRHGGGDKQCGGMWHQSAMIALNIARILTRAKHNSALKTYRLGRACGASAPAAALNIKRQRRRISVTALA